MEKNHHREATTTTPELHADWDAGVLCMAGDCYPENSFEFFQPTIDWVEAFLRQGDRPLQLELRLVYLNTSSVKAMMDILDLLEEAHGQGQQVSVRWLYDQRNERAQMLAEEFREDCTFPFKITAHE
ncbi:MAG: biofilm regulation phosphoprotein SiaC [Halothiobacillaceae bacterium]